MLRTILGGKIHRATVTQADLHYVGSITIDSALCAAADIMDGERVAVVDIDNGRRLETYVIEGRPEDAGAGQICINGAAARLVSPGDLVIIMAYRQATDEEAREFSPQVVHVDGQNHIIEVGSDPAQAAPGQPGQISAR